MLAADHIEHHPKLFNFDTILHPDCDTPGCALGWVAVFAGFAPTETGTWNGAALESLLGLRGRAFYGRMDEIDLFWMGSARRCAPALRKYAHQYHPIGAQHD